MDDFRPELLKALLDWVRARPPLACMQRHCLTVTRHR
jgi:hypothetical protein